MNQSNTNSQYQCESVKIDPLAGILKSDAAEVRLGPVNMRVLMVLIEQAEQVVSRSDLFDSVWQNQVVSDDVLTRCISDLRKQLMPLFGDKKLIETIPKRGYRWILSVSEYQQTPIEDTVNSERTQKETSKRSLLEKSHSEIPNSTGKAISLGLKGWLISVLFGLFFISTGSLWLVDKFLTPKHQKIALIPMQVNNVNEAMVVALEQKLIKNLLQLPQIKVLAKSAVANRPQNPFPYFSREFGTDWLVEGSILSTDGRSQMTLSLVDARSATLAFSLVTEVDSKEPLVDEFVAEFVAKLEKSLAQ